MQITAILEQLRHTLESREADHLDLLRRMVAINSYSANPDGVNRLGTMTAEAFAALGFVAETIQAENPTYGRHLILTRPGRSARTIGLVSHLDTVFKPEEEVYNEFSWRPEGNRIYGPGTVDIKGGTLIIYMMMEALQQQVPQIYDEITWVVLLNACEEVAEDDFGRLCVERLQPNGLACLVFEGGYMANNRFRTVVVRKGMATYEVEVEGKAAHAGSAHDRGANAIVQMAEVVQQIHNLTDYDKQITYNVGNVTGGTVLNRVPHYATAFVEMRAFDTAVFEQGIDEMLALSQLSNVASVNGDFACKVNVALTRKTPPWPRNEATENLFNIWQQAGATLNFHIMPEHRGGLSDGNHTWRSVPTIDGLGPSGGNAHCSERSVDGSKEQEFVYRPSLIPKTVLNIAAILRLLEHAGVNQADDAPNNPGESK